MLEPLPPIGEYPSGLHLISALRCNPRTGRRPYRRRRRRADRRRDRLANHEFDNEAVAIRHTPPDREVESLVKLPEEPHYLGHRERLRERFRLAGGDALPDYELMELVLFRAMPRRDIKPIAKALVARFGSFAEALAAPPERLKEIAGIGDSVVTELKIIEAAARRMTKGAVRQRAALGSWKDVIEYCRAAMAFSEREEFRILFLDKRNGLIADEVQGRGTVDHTPVYPREVVRRALELSASALVLVHNHPSGDPTPSAADVRMTLELIAIAKPLGITIHDHLIVSRNGHAGLRGLKLI